MRHAARLRWTGRGTVLAALGAAALWLGAATGHAAAALAGGTVLLLLAADLLLIPSRLPRATIHTEAVRLPEKARTGVRVECKGAHAGHEVFVPLPPALALAKGSNLWRAGGEHAFDLEARWRGAHAVGPPLVRAWSPLDLWAVEASAGDAVPLDVVPCPEDISHLTVRSKVLLPIEGRFDVNRPGTGFEFFSLRDYAPGDSIRSVNWRASARSEDLIVNQRRRETLGDLTIFVDARELAGCGTAGSTPLDRACRAALALHQDASRSRDVVRIVAYGATVSELRATRSNAQDSATFLAHLAAGGEGGLAQAWDAVRRRLRHHGPAFILSSGEADGGMAATVRQLVGRGHPVTVVSPQPAGPTWDAPASAARRQARAAILDACRGAGAVVVDWKTSQVLAGPSPDLHSVEALA